MLNNRYEKLNSNDLFYVEYTSSSFNQNKVFLHFSFDSVYAAEQVFLKMSCLWHLPVTRPEKNRIVVFPTKDFYSPGVYGEKHDESMKITIRFSDVKDGCDFVTLLKEPAYSDECRKNGFILFDGFDRKAIFVLDSSCSFEKRLVETKKIEDDIFLLFAVSQLLESNLFVGDVACLIKVLLIKMDISPDFLKYTKLNKQFLLNTQSIFSQQRVNKIKMANNAIMQDIDLIIDYLNNGFTTCLHRIDFFASVEQSEKRESIKNMKIACLNCLKECIAEFLYMGGSLNDAISCWKQTPHYVLDDDSDAMDDLTLTMYDIICLTREGEKAKFPTQTVKMIDAFCDKHASNCERSHSPTTRLI